MKTCSKCILPETYPGISFDDKGVCNYCRDYKPEYKNVNSESLLEVLQSVDNPSPYDCVVPLSGGKDSSFILLYIVKELGLNPLVVSYNSGFQHPIAEENVRSACEILGVDLEEIKSPGKIQKGILKASYILSQKMRIAWGCANCPAILRIVPINAARKHKIPFIIWGSSTLETIEGNDYSKDFKALLKMSLKDPRFGFNGFKYIFLRIVQRFLLGFPLRYAFRPFSIPPFSNENPKFIHFYDHVKWDSMRNTQLLGSEIGWKHPVGKESRFDCRLHSIGNVRYLRDYGITMDGLNFSNFVREGKMNRDDALKSEQDIAKKAQDEYDAFLKNIM